jgi:hypothetical protein
MEELLYRLEVAVVGTFKVALGNFSGFHPMFLSSILSSILRGRQTFRIQSGVIPLWWTGWRLDIVALDITSSVVNGAQH